MLRRELLATPFLLSSPLWQSNQAHGQAPAGASLAGFAERDITCQVGMEQPSNYFKQFHKSVHDPLKVRAAVCSDGKQRVAIVSVDALCVPDALVAGARRRITEATSIPPEAILIAASHSHSAGPVGMVQPGEFDHAPPEIQKLAYEQSTMADAGYLAKVESAIVEAVAAADAAKLPSRFGFGAGTEDKVLFNRRFHMKNGETWTHPRKGNPDIVRVAGPVDPSVTITAAFDENRKLRGCLVNYACHATTNPGGISANWIYFMEKVIRGVYGPDVVVVYLAGFSGDVTQVDNLSKDADLSGLRQAEIVGYGVGAEAVKILSRMATGALGAVHASRTVYQQERRQPSPQRLAKARTLAFARKEEVGVEPWVFAKEAILLDWQLKKQPRHRIEVQAVQLGPAIYLTAPGEIFTAFGLQLRKQVRFPFVNPVCLANGIVGYVVTPDALAPGGGGYEQRLTSYTSVTADAGDRMVRELVKLSAAYQPSAVPAEPPAQPGPPWDYGNKGPEPR